jgi:hypothetical protein
MDSVDASDAGVNGKFGYRRDFRSFDTIWLNNTRMLQ